MKHPPTERLAVPFYNLAFRIRRSSLGALLIGLALLGAPGTRAETTLTLDDAIRLALEKNPQIKVDSFGRSIARADLLTAIGKFDPSINFRRSYREDSSLASSNVIVADLIKTDDYSVAFEGTMPWGLNYSLGGSAQNQRYPQTGYVDSFATFGGVTITQPLLRGFGFGPNLLGVRIAKADRSIADWQFRQTVIDTVTNVIGAYSDLAFAQQSYRIAQRSRELAAGLLAENEKKYKVGSISESEVIQARADTATRDEGILLAMQGVRDALNGLRKLIGETAFPIAPEAVNLEPPEAPNDVVVDPAEDLRKALADRPDYQAAKLGLYKFRATHAAARNELLPQLDFVGSYGYNGLDRNFAASRRMVADHDNRSYSAGLVVSIPLTFAQGRGKERSARLHLRQAEADLVRLEQDIAVSVAHAAGQIETTRQRVAADRAALDLAKQALDGELKKFRSGTSNTFFVLQLQGKLISAEFSYFAALADQRRAFAAYDHELGRTLIVRHIELDKN